MLKQAKKKLIRGVMDGALVLYLRSLLTTEKVVQALRKKAEGFLQDKGT